MVNDRRIDAFGTLKGVLNQENLYDFSVGGPLSINAQNTDFEKEKTPQRLDSFVAFFFMLMID